VAAALHATTTEESARETTRLAPTAPGTHSGGAPAAPGTAPAAAPRATPMRKRS